MSGWSGGDSAIRIDPARFDAIVVGAGAAGAVVARTLADSGMKVGLVEAGSAMAPPGITSWDATRAESHSDWYWPNLAATTNTGHQVRYRQGRGLGGGSAVNYMVLAGGESQDYTDWPSPPGGTDWPSPPGGAEAALDTLVSAIDPVVAVPGPLAQAVAQAAVGAGHFSHLVGGHQPGVSSADIGVKGVAPVALAARAGRRRSSADLFLVNAPGVRLISDTEVVSVIVDPLKSVNAKGRVSGVAVRSGGGELGRLNAPLVVLCAGAINTPRLLVLSGLVAPQYRWVVRDHPSFVFTVQLKPAAVALAALDHIGAQGPPPVSTMLRWSQSAASADGGLRVADVVNGGPDGLTGLVVDHVAPWPHRATGRAGGQSVAEPVDYGAVILSLDRPRSKGKLEIDANGKIGLNPGWLAHPGDRVAMVNGWRHVADLLSDEVVAGTIGPALGVYVDDKGTTMAELRSANSDRLGSWLIAHPGPVSHLASSAIGLVDIDSGGAFGGIEGLNVMDASVLPELPSGPPQLAIMALSYLLASDLVN